MQCAYACGSTEHQLARRGFLKSLAAGSSLIAGTSLVGGLSAFAAPDVGSDLARRQKRVLIFNMHGGISQLETWDPKPGTATGGPFRAIPTSVPGIHVSELLPETAQVMQHLMLVRGVNTKEDDHGKGAYMMMTGRRQSPAADYPVLGAVLAKTLTPADSPLPGHIVVTPHGGGGRAQDSAYLGPKYASLQLGNGNPPQYTKRLDAVSESMEAARNAVRKGLDERFLNRRRTAKTDLYTYSYDQARQLMAKSDIFDVNQESETDRARYGQSDFGRHCLLARRLLERGVSCVQVSHSNYDTHHENFNFHLEQVSEFDRPFAMLIRDLVERGLFEDTLVVVLSEFGRTPNINHLYGRDHWSASWSICMGGARVQRGGVYGATDNQGLTVVDGQVDHGQLFHTYLQAVGVDSTRSFNIDGRELPMADPAAHAISAILS